MDFEGLLVMIFCAIVIWKPIAFRKYDANEFFGNKREIGSTEIVFTRIVAGLFLFLGVLKLFGGV